MEIQWVLPPTCPDESNIINPNSTPQNQSAKWLCILVVVIAIAYGLVAFFSIIAFWKSAQRVTGVVAPLGIGVCIATILLTGFWSVLGSSGSYFKRLLVSHLVGLVVAMGVVVGTVYFCWEFDKGPTPTLNWFMYAVYWIPPFSIAVQLPLWFLRGAMGWQLVRGEEEPSLTLSLRDAFLLTLVCALAVAAPRMLVKMNIASTTAHFAGLSEPTLRASAVEQPDGSFTFKDVMVSEENIDEIRAINTKWATIAVYRNLRTSLLTILIGAVLLIPIVFFVFANWKFGCAIGFVYVSGLAAVATWLGSTGTLGGPPLTIGICSAIGAIIVPMLILRGFGFVLRSTKTVGRGTA